MSGRQQEDAIQETVNQLASRLVADDVFRLLLAQELKFDLVVYFDFGNVARDGEYTLIKHPAPAKRRKES